MFKIATWNVNSLRVRLAHVLAWLTEQQPDVLGLQETKLPDAEFPLAEFQSIGYYPIFSGQKTYNGVALLSKQAPTAVVMNIPTLSDEQRRVIAATYGDLRVVNVYVPNGESLVSSKYEYKLRWLQQLRSFLKAELQHYAKLAVIGDFNIAPQDIDIHNPQAWQGSVLASEPERRALNELLDLGLMDTYRQLAPNDCGYSWWNYRAAAFRRNLGLRIDHILTSNALFAEAIKCDIDKKPRAAERPSDHAPVYAEFA